MGQVWTTASRSARKEPGQDPLPAPFFGTLAAFALAGVAPILILMAAPDDQSHGDFVGPMVIAILAALRLSVIVGARARRLFEMVFWLYAYVFLGVAPVIQMRLGANTDTTPGVNHQFDWQTTAVVIAGCLAFLAGVVAFRRRKAGDDGMAAVQRVSRSRANLLTVVALGFFAYYASRIGFSSLFTSRLQLDLIRSMVWTDKTTATLITGVTSMGLLVSTIAQLKRRRQAALDGRPKPVLMPLVSLASLVVCVNPISSARYAFGTVFLALIGAFGAYATVKRFRAVTIAAVFGMVYLFPIADMFRRSLDPNAKSQDPLQSMLSGDFDSFSQITNTIDYVASNGISWGNQMLGVLFFWVPRSVWPDKPIDTGTVVANWKGYGFGNLSSPLWAEFFVNGGWVLVVAGMFAFGALIGRLDRDNERVLAVTGWPSVTACILPFYLLIVLRGSLLQSMASLAVILAASAFVRVGRRETLLGSAHAGMDRTDVGASEASEGPVRLVPGHPR